MPAPADVPDLSGLAALARDPRLDLKPVVLRVQTDLFAAAPARDAAGLREFESLALGLIPTVDPATAAIVARKLGPLPDVPETVLAALARRGGEARGAVLTLVPHLSQAVLGAALEAGGDVGPLVAARGDLAPGTVADLVAQGDPRVDLALALNAAVRLPGAALEGLVARARTRPPLAGVLLARDDLADADLAPLYLFADARRRAAIRRALAAFAALSPARTAPAGAGTALMDCAVRRDAEGFRVRLAAALGLPATERLDFAGEARRDLLAFALRAVGLTAEDAIYVFLTLDAAIAHSVEAVNGLARVFRETDPATARLLLAAILDAPDLAGLPRREGRHVPQAAPDGVKVRAARAAKAPRQAAEGAPVRRTRRGRGSEGR
jgi:hypothetical protein